MTPDPAPEPTSLAVPGTAGDLDALVRRVQGGDNDAFTDLIHMTHNDLRAFLAGRVATVEQLDEVVHRTWIRCYERISNYEHRGTFTTWLKGIGRLVALETLREQQRMLTAEPSTLEHVLLQARLTSGAADEEVAEAEERAHHQHLLSNCLEQLSPGARRLISLRYEDGDRVQDIATRLDKTPNWVSVTLNRIRSALKTCLQGEVAL